MDRTCDCVLPWKEWNYYSKENAIRQHRQNSEYYTETIATAQLRLITHKIQQVYARLLGRK